MDKKTKILFFTVFLLIVFSIGIMYREYILTENYIIYTDEEAITSPYNILSF